MYRVVLLILLLIQDYADITDLFLVLVQMKISTNVVIVTINSKNNN